MALAIAYSISRLRLTLQRGLRGSGQAVVGLYHSHPDGAAQPSASDLAEAWEPELVWIIVAVHGGQTIELAAHLPEPDARRFREIGLRSTLWRDDAPPTLTPEAP